MKCQLRIATKHDYCYLEATVEGNEQEVVDQYFKLRDTYLHMQEVEEQIGPELDNREFDQFLDRYLCDLPIHVETYQKMSPEQQKVVQIIKRAKARIKAKTIKE